MWPKPVYAQSRFLPPDILELDNTKTGCETHFRDGQWYATAHAAYKDSNRTPWMATIRISEKCKPAATECGQWVDDIIAAQSKILKKMLKEMRKK